MAVPNIFGTATAAIPLSQLDSNFATTITLGNTAIQLGNTVTTLNNMTLANVTVSSGSVTLTNITATTANVTTANISGTTTLTNLTASTALALDASKNVVSVTNTGTGNNVLATSPTLVTPALGTPSSGVVTNLTGTASININGTVGATTPDTGAFTTLSATGVTTVQAGTAALPAITTTGDTNTGIFFPAADTIAFSEGGAEAMRINSSGNVFIGTTTNIGGDSGRLSIDQGGGLALLANRTGDGNIVRFYREGSNVGNINVTAGGTAYNTSSDYRLKNSIAPMIGALAKVSLLKPCTYKWNADSSDGQGFIAHELAEVVPGCVTGEKDAVETYTDEDGNEATRPAYQSIDTSFLVATLTAAIQEQQALITSLTARITALEST